MTKIAETGDAAPYATSIARQPDFARRPIGRGASHAGAHPGRSLHGRRRAQAARP
ncbi:hypothetical protein BURMUCF1_3181 [Burkholderia multivorans ATCC BAA-247]|uniref:Uncharacterized protein n=1 Tax=Burkholderia multivorans CGD2 TaxID=513052 RepID=B9BW61_9BURK|nr:hypothetical protein BURMUCGD2_3390 [Burkholderia multivorans CGD2]EEE10731.1 hypothetical protein BURMUCGD2M_3383 [Burkholderia multivorans CGD2M]EJO56628.1 hypothetical protein BURMUCF1_3181 [Burkholderia multivorans ATCC BAA-247]